MPFGGPTMKGGETEPVCVNSMCTHNYQLDHLQQEMPVNTAA